MNENTTNTDNPYRWFALRVAIRKEESVEKEILNTFSRDDVKEILIPTSCFINPYDHKVRLIKKYIPGYMMLHIANDPKLFNRINRIKNVFSFLGDPTPLAQGEIDHMINLINSSEPQQTFFTQLQAGTRVIVKEGPFKDFQGVIASTNLDRANCIVDVYILGRSTPVELSFLQIEQET
jgi:transcription termination/antitermination protein NusG